MTERELNWAGNVAYSAAAIHAPDSVEELQDMVRAAAHARALGSRHSFNAIADTDATLIEMRRLLRVLDIDPVAGTVTAEGGITYGELCPHLHARGFALHNLASLPHISVAGAVATATHGSGVGNGNLATAVRALDIVTATGEIVHIKRGDASFDGAVASVGALGIVSAITLDIEPASDFSQTVYTDLPFDVARDKFEELAASAYSVSFFTRWQGDTVGQLWLKSRAPAPDWPETLHGAKRADRPFHPLPGVDPTPCTEQLGVPGPFHERLPHFRMAFMPSAGEELQSEYFVAREDAPAALNALRAIQHRIAPHLLVSEIRTVAADDLWLSMNYQRASAGFHFTWRRDWDAVRLVLPEVEAALAPFAPRPHWGKLFTMPAAELQSRYERLEDFRALAHKFDPEGKFRNAFLDGTVFA